MKMDMCMHAARGRGSSYATWVAFHKQDLYSGGPGIKFSGYATDMNPPNSMSWF